MTLHPQALAVTAFAAVMAVAAFEDFRRLVIPNLLPLAVVRAVAALFRRGAEPVRRP